MKFERITVNPDQLGGTPCIRGLRIPVATVVGMVADAMTEGEILQAYPDLEREDIRTALRYAAEAVRERDLPLASNARRHPHIRRHPHHAINATRKARAGVSNTD